ncbi:MAG: GDSL-type esterase/lipase family protein [Sumerlaeia bacterium]
MKSKIKLGLQVIILILFIGFLANFFIPKPETQWDVVNLEPLKSGPIVAFGDSLTVGVAVGEEENYPWHFSEAFGEPVYNSGVSGDTTANGLSRLEADVLAYNPRLVFVALGGNDIKAKVPVEVAFGNLRTIIERIQAGGAVVVLMGIDGKFVYGPEYDLAYKALAEETGCILVSDILEDIIGNRSLLLDQVHPNAAGYVVLKDKVLKELRFFQEELQFPEF